MEITLMSSKSNGPDLWAWILLKINPFPSRLGSGTPSDDLISVANRPNFSTSEDETMLSLPDFFFETDERVASFAIDLKKKINMVFVRTIKKFVKLNNYSK